MTSLRQINYALCVLVLLIVTGLGSASHAMTHGCAPDMDLAGLPTPSDAPDATAPTCRIDGAAMHDGGSLQNGCDALICHALAIAPQQVELSFDRILVGSVRPPGQGASIGQTDTLYRPPIL